MSSRMYTATAETMGEERYHETAILLDTALAQATHIAPEAVENSIVKTHEANQILY